MAVTFESSLGDPNLEQKQSITDNPGIFQPHELDSLFSSDYSKSEEGFYVTIPEPAFAAYVVSIFIFIVALLKRRKQLKQRNFTSF